MMVYKTDARGYPIFNQSTGTYEVQESQYPASEVVNDISLGVTVISSVSEISSSIAENFLDFKTLGATLGLVGPLMNLGLSAFGISGDDPVTNLITEEFAKVNDKLHRLSDQIESGFNEIKSMITLTSLLNYKDTLQDIGSKYVDMLAAEGHFKKPREAQFRYACNKKTPFDVFRDLYEHACTGSWNAIQITSRQPDATHGLYQMQKTSDYKIQLFMRTFGNIIIANQM